MTPMNLGDIVEAPAAALFKVQKSDVVINVEFGSYFWSLVHDIPKFYTALLVNLGEFGVNPTSIRSETGENLGAYNVNFWMLNFKALVKIRLERMEFSFNNITDLDIDRSVRAFQALMAALAASDENLKINGYRVEWGLHGFVEGATPRELIGRFVTSQPSGIGPSFGAGAIFYFGKDSVDQTITLDLSGAVTDALYLRLIGDYQGAPPAALRETFTERLGRSLASVGLRSE